MVQEQFATFLAQVEARTSAGLPDFVQDEFKALLECGALAHGFLRLRCATSLQAALYIDRIALAARNVPKHLQKKAIAWGTIGAIVVRSSMTVVVVWLLKIPGLLLAGGALLVWIAY